MRHFGDVKSFRKYRLFQDDVVHFTHYVTMTLWLRSSKMKPQSWCCIYWIIWYDLYRIHRLNSGIKNRNNFFAWVIFLIQKVGTNSVIYADSGDIKILVQFPGNSILKILQNFWKCVGGVYMRGCLILKITQSVQLFTLIIFIYKIRCIHLISWQPTQFQPP